MTVSELIEWLQKQPPDYLVCVAYDDFLGETDWTRIGRTDTPEPKSAYGNWDVKAVDGSNSWNGGLVSSQQSIYICPKENKLSASKTQKQQC